jgi:hypothetical protein
VSIHTERVTARHASGVMSKKFKWYSYITTVHTEGVMTRLYIVYHLDVTRRDAFSANGPLRIWRRFLNIDFFLDFWPKLDFEMKVTLTE